MVDAAQLTRRSMSEARGSAPAPFPTSMILERRTVSRKTSGDGRLEITKRAAGTLVPLEADLTIEIAGRTTPASIGTRRCTCRGADNPHVHYFIESGALRALAPGSEIDLDFDAESKTVRIIRRGGQ